MNESIVRMRDYVRGITDIVPKVAITLGSGLGGFADTIRVEARIPYRDIPGFPVSTAPGHAGELIIGYLNDLPVLCLNGRVHMYEGYGPEDVSVIVRLSHALGARILLSTNAAGGIKESYYPGKLALITDHISLFITYPLIGPNDDEDGVRFPDMSDVYDMELRDIVTDCAKKEGIDLDTGIYAQLSGPSFETPAEIRLLKSLGVDLVGMSTVVESIAARHLGMRVCGISLVSNYAAGISEEKLSSEEVNAAAQKAGDIFAKLVTASVERFGKCIE